MSTMNFDLDLYLQGYTISCDVAYFIDYIYIIIYIYIYMWPNYNPWGDIVSRIISRSIGLEVKVTQIVRTFAVRAEATL